MEWTVRLGSTRAAIHRSHTSRVSLHFLCLPKEPHSRRATDAGPSRHCAKAVRNMLSPHVCKRGMPHDTHTTSTGHDTMWQVAVRRSARGVRPVMAAIELQDLPDGLLTQIALGLGTRDRWATGRPSLVCTLPTNELILGTAK